MKTVVFYRNKNYKKEAQIFNYRRSTFTIVATLSNGGKYIRRGFSKEIDTPGRFVSICCCCCCFKFIFLLLIIVTFKKEHNFRDISLVLYIPSPFWISSTPLEESLFVDPIYKEAKNKYSVFISFKLHRRCWISRLRLPRGRDPVRKTREMNMTCINFNQPRHFIILLA